MLDDADPDHPVRAGRELIRNLHASAAGQLLLATQSTTWQRLLPTQGLRQLTSATLTNLAALDEAICAVRANEFALQRDQLEEGLACAAIPIPDTAGYTAGALASPDHQVVPKY